MKPEEYFCVKVNRLEFVLFTLHISHNSSVCLNSKSLAKDFFKLGFPPCAHQISNRKINKNPPP